MIIIIIIIIIIILIIIIIIIIIIICFFKGSFQIKAMRIHVAIQMSVFLPLVYGVYTTSLAMSTAVILLIALSAVALYVNIVKKQKLPVAGRAVVITGCDSGNTCHTVTSLISYKRYTVHVRADMFLTHTHTHTTKIILF